MGNSFGCSASGERLVSAARDGDLVEAKMLLDCNPCLSRYSTFGGLNSPLHFAAAKGHNEIVALLLDNGADVNSRNYCGQTALMQACRYGHWEVVQTLLLFNCSVTRADYLSGRTALHFAAVNGHVRCIRLVVADFVPSAPFESINAQTNCDRDNYSNMKSKYDQSALSKFVNKAADGGITALHMAALNGYSDYVQLLLDLRANVSSVTFHYGTSMDLIGAGSTSLHYAACGGNLKCCQILLARGASRLTLNCNGWLPLDVARTWGRHWLEPLLDPNSDSTIPMFPPSYLSLPLLSVLNIAREYGLQTSATCCDDAEICAVCLERACTVAAEGGKWGRGGGHVDGPSEDAKFSNDFDVAYIGSSCSLLVVDRGNQAIREIQLREDDCTYQYDGNLNLGIAVLVAAAFFGYMLALLQRRVTALFSSHSDSETSIRKGIPPPPHQRPFKPVRPPLIPAEDESEKAEEGLFGSLGRLFLNTGSSVVEIFTSLFSGRKKPLHHSPIQQQYYQQPINHSNTWPMQESYVIPREDEPPALDTRTPTPRNAYPYMTKDTEKNHQFKQSQAFNSGWNGGRLHHQQQQHMQQQQHHQRHYSSGPQTYYEQSCETNEIVFGAVQEQDGRREAVVIKAMDYGDPKYNNHNIRSRYNYMGYSYGY